MSQPRSLLHIVLMPLVAFILAGCGGTQSEQSATPKITLLTPESSVTTQGEPSITPVTPIPTPEPTVATQAEPSATPVTAAPTPEATVAALVEPSATLPAASPTTPAPSATATSAKTATETPTAPSAIMVSLSETGPWWAFFIGEGIWADSIWAVNPDGSGLTELARKLIIVPQDLNEAVAPTGGLLAFATAADTQLRGLTLNLLKLPEGEIRSQFALSSPDTEPEPGADPALRPPEPLVAISSEVGFAWSPDGQQLAFMAAFEGPSSDLYVYSLQDERLTRLTDGPSEGIRPTWSPDGKYILHFGVETLGTGAGYTMSGVWAARADDSGVKSLYDVSGSSNEVIVGWVSQDTFAVYTHSFSRGGTLNLRTVNIETGAVQVLWEGLFNGAALDTTSGNLLLAVGPRADESPGLYLVPPDGAPTQRIVEDVATRLSWSDEADLFFALTEFGVLAVSAQGEFIDVALPPSYSGFPVFAPDTRELAWTGSSLWIGSLLSSLDNPPRQVYPQAAVKAAWGPEGQLLFFGKEGLFAAQPPAFEPGLIAEGLSTQHTVWVVP